MKTVFIELIRPIEASELLDIVRKAEGETKLDFNHPILPGYSVGHIARVPVHKIETISHPHIAKLYEEGVPGDKIRSYIHPSQKSAALYWNIYREVEDY